MVERCDLVLYDGYNYTGNQKRFYGTGSADVVADRDNSAQLTQTCANTSYIVLEHPYSVDNGGVGYLMGARDKVDGIWDKHQHQDGQRYWKRGRKAAEIIRINIPVEDRDKKILRHNLDIHGRRLRTTDDAYLYIKKGSEESGTNGANSPEQLLSDRNDKGQPCPGGEAYWLNATDGQKNSTSASTRKSQVACVYRSKDGLKDLHSSLKGPSDIRKVMYNELVNKYCDRATRLNDRISSDNSNNQCKDVAETKTQQRDWCSIGDKIKTDKTLCNKEEIGTSLYDELAAKYCDANPDDPFCGCYNVVTNKCKGEDIDKEIKKLEAGRKAIDGVRYVWYGFNSKNEYLNIAQIEVYSDGVNIVKDIDDSKVTVGSHGYGTTYRKNLLFDGNYDTFYHSGLEVGWKTTSNKRYDWQKVKYVSLGYGADASYNAKMGSDDPGEEEKVSVGACKKACAGLPKCKSTLYNKNGKSCHMTSSTPGGTSTASSTNHDIIEKIGDTYHNYVKIDLGKEYTIDQVKVFNRKSCGANGECNDRWAGSFVKLLRSNGSLIKASERVVGDHKQGGERVKTFFDNGVGAAKAKANIPGCKITVPIRRTLTDLPRKYSAALDGADKCWGNVCASKGGDTFVPENAIAAGGICSKSMTICNVDLRAGNLQDSEINIEQKCGEYEGEPSPMSEPSSNEPSEPSDGSTDGTPAPMGSSSVPVTPSSTPTSSSTPSVVAGTASTEELKIYEKPSVQIGTVASSLVSISSCALLIMLAM